MKRLICHAVVFSGATDWLLDNRELGTCTRKIVRRWNDTTYEPKMEWNLFMKKSVINLPLTDLVSLVVVTKKIICSCQTTNLCWWQPFWTIRPWRSRHWPEAVICGHMTVVVDFRQVKVGQWNQDGAASLGCWPRIFTNGKLWISLQVHSFSCQYDIQ